MVEPTLKNYIKIMKILCKFIVYLFNENDYSVTVSMPNASYSYFVSQL